jgi:1,2-diacylglycerol 3-beta-glucosyltransferase
MTLLIAVAATFGLFVVAVFILYVVSSTYLLRSEPPRLAHGDPGDFEWHIIVPALNEAAVLDETLLRLTSLSFAHLWVVNDASDDATGEIAERWRVAHEQVHVVTRTLPNARTGKGSVLNAAYCAIVEWKSYAQYTQKPAETSAITVTLPAVTLANSEALGTEAVGSISASSMRTIVGVVDADGVLDPNTFGVLSSAHCFSDASVGAVQQDVWMLNADETKPFPNKGRWRNYVGSTLLRLQDVEFRASIAAIQHTRHHTSSVAMGGNGQWTRLEALNDIVLLDDSLRHQRGAMVDESALSQRGPWHGGLLEDFELGLHLLMTGWVTRFTPGCYVAQEALPSVSLYLRQRTRWCQGSMQCLRYLPRLWNSAFIGPWALLELCYYLFQPWLWIFGTFLFPLPLIDAGRAFVRSPTNWFAWVRNDGGWMWLVMFWGTAVLPLMSWAFTYRAVRAHSKQIPVSRRRAFHDGLAYVVLVNLSYVIAWRSLWRLVRKRNGWVKTSRLSEQLGSTPVALLETSSPS